MRLLSVVGARPQFVKAAVICKALAKIDGGAAICHRIVHTGQHYDPLLSEVFFQELDIPPPDHNLEVGSGSHAAQTGEMMMRLEPVLAAEEPDWMLLYGDTNSTLAGAIVGSKLGLKMAHVEAGLRSYNRLMPEEINRIVADRLCDLLLCPTPLSVENLRKEGLGGQAVLTGDVMYDAALAFRERAELLSGPMAQSWRAGEFALATVHRAENTDDAGRLRAILRALDCIARRICPVLLPLHPRTQKRLADLGVSPEAVTVTQPATYLEILQLESRARFILTDSGGVQKEAYFAKVPCITLREETEWEETLENDCNVLAGASVERIVAAAEDAGRAGPWTPVYGDGQAGEHIVRALRKRVA